MIREIDLENNIPKEAKKSSVYSSCVTVDYVYKIRIAGQQCMRVRGASLSGGFSTTPVRDRVIIGLDRGSGLGCSLVGFSVVSGMMRRWLRFLRISPAAVRTM